MSNAKTFEVIEQFHSVINSDENIADSDESETDGHLEMRSVDSETDNEVSEEDISDDEQEDNYYVELKVSITILPGSIKPEYLNVTELDKIQYCPEHYLESSDMYLGAKVEALLINNNLSKSD
ncbi:hypothetical protein FQA39_LY00302 [Lamprigera yunnana]|nr:hypothetical protein FQA39_LY00302 [Lamprigera yunnana]